MALIQNTTEDKAHMPEEYHAAMRAAEAEQRGPVYNMKNYKDMLSLKAPKSVHTIRTVHMIVLLLITLGANLQCLYGPRIPE